MRLLGEVSKLLRKPCEEEIVESIRESREDELSARRQRPSQHSEKTGRKVVENPERKLYPHATAKLKLRVKVDNHFIIRTSRV